MTYEEKLNALLDEIFTAADQRKIPHVELALRAGVCVRTVARNASYETRLPRLKTILGLASAVGMTLELTLTRGKRKVVA